jgi:hypothetical protein
MILDCRYTGQWADPKAKHHDIIDLETGQPIEPPVFFADDETGYVCWYEGERMKSGCWLVHCDENRQPILKSGLRRIKIIPTDEKV